MFKDNHAFSGFAVNDLDQAKEFYEKTLGVEITDEPMGLIGLKIDKGAKVLVYAKPDHVPATFTILNFPVTDIDAAVDELTKKGITFEQYDNEWVKTDAKGIARGGGGDKGPNIAWFKDPAGNVLSVIENSA